MVYGVGINDIRSIKSTELVEGVRQILWRCPYYEVWLSVLQRCYSDNFHKQYPTYLGCTVEPSWLLFSEFKSWMASQDWVGNRLDKDILVKGNKHYSPTTCCFVPNYVNTCLLLSQASRANLPIGVSLYHHNSSNPKIYKAVIKNRRYGKDTEVLGRFFTPSEAHKAWQVKKIEIIKLVIDDYKLESCFRQDVFMALSERISKLQRDVDNSFETKDI